MKPTTFRRMVASRAAYQLLEQVAGSDAVQQMQESGESLTALVTERVAEVLGHGVTRARKQFCTLLSKSSLGREEGASWWIVGGLKQGCEMTFSCQIVFGVQQSMGYENVMQVAIDLLCSPKSV